MRISFFTESGISAFLVDHFIQEIPQLRDILNP
jgi:hypothetical protein